MFLPVKSVSVILYNEKTNAETFLPQEGSYIFKLDRIMGYHQDYTVLKQDGGDEKCIFNSMEEMICFRIGKDDFVSVEGANKEFGILKTSEFVDVFPEISKTVKFSKEMYSSFMLEKGQRITGVILNERFNTEFWINGISYTIENPSKYFVPLNIFAKIECCVRISDNIKKFLVK